jgi:transposase
MENASAAFLGAIRRNMRDIRRALGQGPVDSTTLTAAEGIQYDGWRRRMESDAVVLTLHAEGVALKEIVRRTGRSRKLVRGIVRGERTDTFRPRGSSLTPWFDRLDAEWQEGCRNGAELWRRLRAAGFEGSLRVVTEWMTRRRRDDIADAPRKCPAPRTLPRLTTLARDHGRGGDSRESGRRRPHRRRRA